MTTLNEGGLLHNDLDNLVLPLLDIDTFESKIDDSRSIVVAFYVFEPEPARDLDSFISKSSLEIFDTEASPAPTTDGYYVVFVEIERNNQFPKTVMDLVSEINNLTSNTKWRFKVYGQDNLFDLSENNLKNQVNLDPSKVKQSSRDAEDSIDLAIDMKDTIDKKEKATNNKEKSLAESAIPLLIDSLAESIHCEGDTITLNLTGVSRKYQVIMVEYRESRLPILMPAIGTPILTETLKLSAILGNTYNVNVVNDGILVENSTGYIILRSLI
jgi:hypothetical protein